MITRACLVVNWLGKILLINKDESWVIPSKLLVGGNVVNQVSQILLPNIRYSFLPEHIKFEKYLDNVDECDLLLVFSLKTTTKPKILEDVKWVKNMDIVLDIFNSPSKDILKCVQ